tara:strand:- start:146 stop:460 length:315 start_codon:yes stop_codon:yes gene_type:complete
MEGKETSYRKATAKYYRSPKVIEVRDEKRDEGRKDMAGGKTSSTRPCRLKREPSFQQPPDSFRTPPTTDSPLLCTPGKMGSFVLSGATLNEKKVRSVIMNDNWN